MDDFVVVRQPLFMSEMKVPETPPIHIARSNTKEVVVERPKVIGSKRAIPSVAERPGIAPNTIPRETIAMMRMRFTGFRQTSIALK